MYRFLLIRWYPVPPLDIHQEEFNRIPFPSHPILESKRVIGYYGVSMPDNTQRHVGFDYEHKNLEEQPAAELSILGDKRIQYAISIEFENVVLGDVIADAHRMISQK